MDTKVSQNDAHAGHEVRFYEDDSFIYDAVTDFYAAGLHAGQPLVLISTVEHRDGILNRLSSRGVDCSEAVATGRLLWLNATETLSKVMVDGMPDGELFRKYVGEALEQVRFGREHLTIRAFGEMVDILMRDGKPEAALCLEELWNNMGKVYGFSLLCAYSIGNLYHEEHWRYFRRICDLHSPLPQDQIGRVQHAREAALSARHLSSSTVRDFTLGQLQLNPAQLAHLSDCDGCSELWWRIKQAAKAG